MSVTVMQMGAPLCITCQSSIFLQWSYILCRCEHSGNTGGACKRVMCLASNSTNLDGLEQAVRDVAMQVDLLSHAAVSCGNDDWLAIIDIGDMT